MEHILTTASSSKLLAFLATMIMTLKETWELLERSMSAMPGVLEAMPWGVLSLGTMNCSLNYSEFLITHS